MTTQATKQGPQGRQGVRTPVLMTALTLAALGAVALWQVRPGGEETATPAAGRTTQSAVTERMMTSASPVEQYPEEWRAPPAAAAIGVSATDQALYQRWQARSAAAPGMVYLVASVEQQRALTEVGLNADDLVLVVTTDEDAAQVRLGQGQPGVAVIDVRTRAAGARGVCTLADPPAEC